MFKDKIFLTICTIFLFTIMLNLGSSVPPVTTVQDFPEGYVIEEALHEFLKLNETHQYNFFVFNSTNGIEVTDDEINCTFYLANETGHLLFKQSAVYSDEYWSVNIMGGNFSKPGNYPYGLNCKDDYGGSLSGIFKVTESGLEITEGRSILVIGLLCLLVGFLFLSLFSLFNTENYIGKFALYWVSHVLIVLITFVGWQSGVEGLLEGFALTGIFRIMFWVFTVGMFPMILLSVAWVVYIHTVNDHFQRLMEKGEDPETAFSLAKRKTGRRRKH